MNGIRPGSGEVSGGLSSALTPWLGSVPLCRSWTLPPRPAADIDLICHQLCNSSCYLGPVLSAFYSCFSFSFSGFVLFPTSIDITAADRYDIGG